MDRRDRDPRHRRAQRGARASSRRAGRSRRWRRCGKLSSPHAKAIRDGRSQNLPAAELVPGDRIDLEPGDRVPADVRLISTAGLRVEEAALTGESVPADKDHRDVLDAQAPLGDRVNMAYMGTAVAAGTASAVVVATGMAHRDRATSPACSSGRSPSPRRCNAGSRSSAGCWSTSCSAIVAIMFIVQVLRGGKLSTSFLLSVSLAVAAVPEGLSAVVTVALALGLQRMARRNALIRRLPSVETLGAVTVICTDKTGTLTRNEMTVREIEAGGQRLRGHRRRLRAAGEVPAASDRRRGERATASRSTRGRTGPVAGADGRRWCSHAQVTRAAATAAKWELRRRSRRRARSSSRR